ncbi:hypothetical protein NL676_030207 [Syzygium grande]|nr:hypothetical protein NL676_030207 [Syzygium grande]
MKSLMTMNDDSAELMMSYSGRSEGGAADGGLVDSGGEGDGVQALNRIFRQWNLVAPPNEWNFSGEPCSGVALSATSIDNSGYQPYIRCNCSYDNGSVCHITQLRIYELNVVGSIPREIWSLRCLTYLNLGRNLLTGSISAQVGNLSRMQYLRLTGNAFSGKLPNEIGSLTELLTV